MGDQQEVKVAFSLVMWLIHSQKETVTKQLGWVLISWPKSSNVMVLPSTWIGKSRWRNPIAVLFTACKFATDGLWINRSTETVCSLMFINLTTSVSLWRVSLNFSWSAFETLLKKKKNWWGMWEGQQSGTELRCSPTHVWTKMWPFYPRYREGKLLYSSVGCSTWTKCPYTLCPPLRGGQEDRYKCCSGWREKSISRMSLHPCSSFRIRRTRCSVVLEGGLKTKLSNVK